MTGLLVNVSIVAALVLLIPTSVLFCEVLLSMVPKRSPMRGGARPSLAVLIPAHDEGTRIGATIRSITPRLVAGDQLLVVADNCSDRTADVAVAEGAQVVVRTDGSNRGKGYALDFGIRHLASHHAPEVVIIIDADCDVFADSLDRLARLCAATGRPVQSMYTMHAAAGSSFKVRIAEFAWIVKNRVRPTGLSRLGLPCQLMGTGMAFPWVRISSVQLATGHIVEDLKLGIELARDGHAPLFCPDAIVTSTFPETASGIQGQRTRWEHGHLGVMLRDGPRLMIDAILTGNRDLMVLALDLMVPPLALLTLMVGGLWFLCALLLVLTHSVAPFLAASCGVLMLAIAVTASWLRYARHVISMGALLLAIPYALWKLPLYLRFLVARQVTWVRSDRTKDKP